MGKVKADGKTGNLRNMVLIEGLKNKITVFFFLRNSSKRHLKHLTKKCFRRVLASDNEIITFIISRLVEISWTKSEDHLAFVL